MRAIDLTGQRFGRWTVVRLADEHARGAKWLCRCDCGTERAVRAHGLQSGNSKSCGCFSRETASALLRKHGQAKTPEYRVWCGMVKRCADPNRKSYGGRGITVCERWRFGEGTRGGFECFRADTGPRPYGLSIDRIDNDKGYSPDNSRWTTWRGQARNRRPPSDETKAKLSASRLGMKRSAETRAKLADAARRQWAARRMDAQS